MNALFFKKIFAHPILIALVSVAVVLASVSVGYASWVYEAISVSPDATAYDNGKATAGAFNFAYEVATEYPTTTTNAKGGFFDSTGAVSYGTFDVKRVSKNSNKYWITNSYWPNNSDGSGLISAVFPVYFTKSGSTYTGSSSATNYVASGLADDTVVHYGDTNTNNSIYPYSYTKIGKYAESGIYYLTSISFEQVGSCNESSSLTIGNYAFYNDYSLTYANFSSNLTSIGSYAFSYTEDASYSPSATIYATYPGSKAEWLSKVTLGSNWHARRSVVVKCSDYYLDYDVSGTLSTSPVVA
jgi:hypothetical protein